MKTEITVALIAGLCGAIPSIIATITTVKRENNKQQKTICKEIEEIKAEQATARVDILKNFIVRCLDDLERDIIINDTTKERLYEALDTYTNQFHQNSYIHKRVEKLEKEGKL